MRDGRKIGLRLFFWSNLARCSIRNQTRAVTRYICIVLHDTVSWKDIVASPRRDGTISTGLDTVYLNLA